MKQHTAYASYDFASEEWYFYPTMKIARHARDLSKRLRSLIKKYPGSHEVRCLQDQDYLDDLFELENLQIKTDGFCGFTDFIPKVKPNKKDSIVIVTFKY